MITYVVVTFVGVPEVGPAFSAWFLIALSVLFVWSYIALAGGLAAVSLAVVFFVTLLFPLTVLAFISWPGYQSWTAMLGAFISASYEHDQLWELEMALPFAAASAAAMFINRQRANIALNADEPPGPCVG
jgi:hypothetical protein